MQEDKWFKWTDVFDQARLDGNRGPGCKLTGWNGRYRLINQLHHWAGPSVTRCETAHHMLPLTTASLMRLFRKHPLLRYFTKYWPSTNHVCRHGVQGLVLRLFICTRGHRLEWGVSRMHKFTFQTARVFIFIVCCDSI